MLITNRSLASRSGTELYVAELALALLARGHSPILYAPRRGELAEQLRRQSVIVRSSLDDMALAPDVIHGHHRVATMTALTRFPGVPVISFAHDFTHPDDATPVHRSVQRYVAVDYTNRDRLLDQDGIDPGKVEVRLNWFDAKRFKPRTTPLPALPKRALVLSNQAVEGSGFLPILRVACERFEIELDVAGLGVGKVLHAPESILGTYDIVFAKARAAIEAMASGCATILCDAAGFGGLVTANRVSEIRRLNFGLRSLRAGHAVDLVAASLAAYDAVDAAEVSAFIRSDADMDTAVDGLVELYRSVIEGQDQNIVHDPAADDDSAESDARAMSNIFHAISLHINQLEDHGHLAAMERNQLAFERETLLARTTSAEVAAAGAPADLAEERLRADRSERALAALAHDHAVILGSTTFRVRDALIRNRPLLSIWRSVRRSSAQDASKKRSM